MEIEEKDKMSMEIESEMKQTHYVYDTNYMINTVSISNHINHIKITKQHTKSYQNNIIKTTQNKIKKK